MNKDLRKNLSPRNLSSRKWMRENSLINWNSRKCSKTNVRGNETVTEQIQSTANTGLNTATAPFNKMPTNKSSDTQGHQ